MIDLHDFFEEHESEFLKFDRVTNRLSNRADLHAFMLLDKLIPGTQDIVSDATHDEIFLNISPGKLLEVATPEQLIELRRCGVRYSQEYDSLCMFT